VSFTPRAKIISSVVDCSFEVTKSDARLVAVLHHQLVMAVHTGPVNDVITRQGQGHLKRSARACYDGIVKH
jgi:hypothetical protein